MPHFEPSRFMTEEQITEFLLCESLEELLMRRIYCFDNEEVNRLLDIAETQRRAYHLTDGLLRESLGI